MDGESQRRKLISVEAVAADELAHDACGGNLVVNVCLVNVVKYFNHRSYLVVALVGGLDHGEQGINVLFKNCKFIESGAIEDNVGIFLIGEDPSFLAAANRIPHRESSLNAGASCLKVAYRAAKQTKIAGGNPVMVVEAKGKKGTDEHSEDKLRIKLLGEKHRIEAVNTLNDDYRILVKTKLMSRPYAPSELEAEGGDFHLFAIQKG